MNRKKFWDLIETTRPKTGDGKEHLQRVEKALSKLNAKDLVNFEEIRVTLMHESYDARLWEVLAILCGGGCGDDSFDYFRNWLIMQGKKVFAQVLEEPQQLPELYPPGQLGFVQELGSLASSVFAERFPESDFDAYYDGPYGPGELQGELWNTDAELQAKYPEIWEKYFGAYD